MTTMIPFDEGQNGLDWLALTDALAAGHQRPKATVEDVFLYRDPDTLLNRSAWIDGMGLAVKCATIFPANKGSGTPMIHGAVNLFSDTGGQLEAILDFHLVTKWKTAFPDAEFTVWNRSAQGAAQFAKDCDGVRVATDLEAAVKTADIITSATMTTEPVLRGEWFQPGQHIDLIGAYRPDMREVDDATLLRARVFVDSFETTMGHIGELKIPLAAGVISDDHVLADYYQLDRFQRQSDDDITLFKNGGGAHLDLMTSRYILDVWKVRRT